MMLETLGPCSLEGRFVRLEPLREKHAAALTEVALRMDWGWMLTTLRSREDVDRRIAEGLKYEARFVGFDAPNEFLVGYGLDHAENFRHLPYIASLQ